MNKIYITSKAGDGKTKLKCYNSEGFLKLVESNLHGKDIPYRIYVYEYDVNDVYECIREIKNGDIVTVRKGVQLPISEWVEKIISEYPDEESAESAIGAILYYSNYVKAFFKKV